MSTINPKGKWTLVAAIALGLAGPAAFPQAAQADEIVRTSTEASLRARPGERAPTLARLEEGQAIRVLGRQGRWLKVSYKGKVGWVTRTQVSGDASTVSARTTNGKKRPQKAKARKKGFNSLDDQAVGADSVEDAEGDEPEVEEEAVAEAEPEEAPVEEEAPAPKADKKKSKKMAKAGLAEGDEVMLAKKTSVRAKPTKKSDELWAADEGASMKVLKLSDDGNWARVEDSEGEKGWVAASSLVASSSDEGGSVAGDAIESDSSPSVVRSSSVGRSRLTIKVNADVGILSRAQTYESAGTGDTANYALTNTAPAAILGGSVMYNMGSLSFGGEVSGYQTVGGAGVTVGDTDETLAWSALQVDARAVGQYWLSSSYAVSARAGYHIEAITVDESDVARLPSENLAGFTVGAALEAPRLTSKLGARLGVDFLAAGTLLQTENFQDGDTSTVSSLFVSAGGQYAITSKLSAHASYQLSLQGYAFDGVNARDVTAQDAKRADTQHVFGLGVGYQF